MLLNSRVLPSRLGYLLLVLLVFISPLVYPLNVLSQSDTTSDQLEQKQKEIEEIERELSRLGGEKQTLSSTISYLDNKIKITQIQIDQTELQLDKLNLEIQELTLEIDHLDISLEQITKVLVNRVGDTYKRSRINPITFILANTDLSQILSLYKYLQISQKHDRQVMYQLETTRLELDQQKELKQQKQQELDQLSQTLATQKTSLDRQQAEKQILLETTKNDEKRFQAILAQKRAELEAIQSIIAGKGDETEVGDVGQGDLIASVIPGSSACSTGGHLHFEVVQNGSHRNPADYLSSVDVTWDNSPDSPFSFSGSWPWPIPQPIRITQGYGMTYYAGTLRYYGGSPHTGIDMINRDDFSVRAVKPGTLYRGAISCGGGTLRYVRVDHQEGDISTYYLHINYR